MLLDGDQLPHLQQTDPILHRTHGDSQLATHLVHRRPAFATTTGTANQIGMLYECHNENSPYDNEQIRADFNELYQKMNGMPLREMDKIIYPVCKLCRDHENAGFIEEIKIGIQLQRELTQK